MPLSVIQRGVAGIFMRNKHAKYKHSFKKSPKNFDNAVSSPSPAANGTKTQIQYLNEDLEKRIASRTRELENLNKELEQKIQELENAQKVLRASEERWRSLLNSAPEVISLLSRDGTVLFVNRTYPGLSREEIIGTHVCEWAKPGQKRKLHDMLARAFEKREIVSQEMPGYGPHRSPAWFVTRMAPIINDGAVESVIMFSIDITERKKAEEAIKTQNDLYSSLLKAQSDLGEGVAIIDRAKKRFLYVNDAACTLLGYSRKELLELASYDSLLAPDRPPRFSGKTAHGIQQHYETEIIRPDGSRIYLEGSLMPITGHRNAICVTIIRDISQRKEIEEKLRESERRLSEAQQIAHIGNWTWDLATSEITWSDELYRIFGLSPQETRIDLETFLSFVHPDDQRNVRKLVEESRKNNTPFDYDHRIIRPDGKERTVHVRNEFIYDSENKPVLMVGTAQDITDRKQLSEKLEEYTRELERKVAERTAALERKLLEEEREKVRDEALLGSIGESVVAIDENYSIVYINNQTERMIGREAHEVLGKSFIDLMDFRDENDNPIPLEKRPSRIAMMLGKKITTTEYYIVHRNGKRTPVAITSSPIILYEKIVGAILVFRDISKEKALDRTKSEFVSLASHQLRTPISIISWYTEKMIKDDSQALPPGHRIYLNELYQANARMIELVNSLLNVSRIELGTLAIDPAPTDLTELVESSLSELFPKIQEKELCVKTDYERSLDPIIADPNHMRIVFQNLISNAVKYTPPRGTITVSIKKRPRKIHIAVKDTGYGIPLEQQAKIFTKLFRADNVRENVPDGSGLGLYIVKSIVEQANGKIWFSSAENKGSAFMVELPMKITSDKKSTKEKVKLSPNIEYHS